MAININRIPITTDMDFIGEIAADTIVHEGDFWKAVTDRPAAQRHLAARATTAEDLWKAMGPIPVGPHVFGDVYYQGPGEELAEVLTAAGWSVEQLEATPPQRVEQLTTWSATAPDGTVAEFLADDDSEFLADDDSGEPRPRTYSTAGEVLAEIAGAIEAGGVDSADEYDLRGILADCYETVVPARGSVYWVLTAERDEFWASVWDHMLDTDDTDDTVQMMLDDMDRQGHEKAGKKRQPVAMLDEIDRWSTRTI